MSRTGQWGSVVFFDLDATLLWGPFETAVFPTVFAAISAQTGATADAIRARVFAAYYRRLRGGALPAVQAVDWQEILTQAACELGAELHCEVREIVEAHTHPPFALARPGALAALRRLATPRRALVAATNGLAQYQRPVLAGLGLLPWFTDVLTPDVHKALKNEIGFYGRWAATGRVRISVGDTYEDDVVAPHAFGFRTIWVPHAPQANLQNLDPVQRPAHVACQAGQLVRPDAVVFGLHEVPALVERFEQAALQGRVRKQGTYGFRNF